MPRLDKLCDDKSSGVMTSCVRTLSGQVVCEQVKLCEDMCQDKLCENIIRTSCGASKWCDNKLCVDKLCDNKLCGGKLCVSKWCEDKLCVDKLCVGKLCVDKLCGQGVGGQVV